MSKLLIVDGNSLAYRCYYALKNTPSGLLLNSDGVPITISKTFLQSLNKILSEIHPDYLAIAFDPGGKTIRHEIYPEYKGQRQKDENYENIKIDLRNLKFILKDLGVQIFTPSIYEADDAIATIVARARHPQLEIIIFSADKDLLQLVDDAINVSVEHRLGSKTIRYKEAEIISEFGVEPWQIADFKALTGDKSDNIPGVKGIGKISAKCLLEEYNNVENILENLDTIKPIFKKKISPHIVSLLKYKQLTKLKKIASFYWDLNSCSVKKIKNKSDTAEELQINSLLKVL